MMTEEKAKEINKIDKQIIALMRQSFAECKKPPAKRLHTALKRCGKIIGLSIQMRLLEMQKRMIIAQPEPRFPPGSFQTGQIGEMYHELPTDSNIGIEKLPRQTIDVKRPAEGPSTKS